MNRYRQIRIPGAFDPLAIVSRLADSEFFGNYVVYERDRCWYMAGSPLGDVIVDAFQVRSNFGDGDVLDPWSGTPWPQVRSALARAPVEDWNAYGWAAFELASRPDADHSATLAHLIVPGIEIQASENQVLIRFVDDAMSASAQQLVEEQRPGERAGPASVDIHIGGDSYRDSVARAVEAIQQERLQKVVLSRNVPVAFPVDMPGTYVLGRSNNTPARSFLLDLGDWQAAGFSPETVVEASASGLASTQPLAGTRARTVEAALDRDLSQALQADPKEIFEHATSVKLAFDEMTGVGQPDSTRVSEFLTVKPRGSVQHLSSRVETDLGEHSAWDALAAVFPAVTASGIPKQSAYELIRELEEDSRGLYAGTVLMASSDGSLDAALVLRAVYQCEGQAWLRAGAGVVGDSRPEREYEETCEKLGSIAPYLVPCQHDGPAPSHQDVTHAAS